MCFNPPGGFGAFGTSAAFARRSHPRGFNPPGGFGAFGTTCSSGDGRFRRSFNPPGGFGAFGTWCRRRSKPQQATVSIRRADLGLSERKLGLGRTGVAVGFNPPGGFGAFGTRPDARMERSLESFNPPGGFGAFGTDAILIGGGGAELFQSAGRIWGFRNLRPRRSLIGCGIGFNPPGGFGAFGTPRFWEALHAKCGVSIRRADLGLSELSDVSLGRCSARFQSAGRIWGFRNATCSSGDGRFRRSFNPPGGFGAFGTLSCRDDGMDTPSFNPPGGFGAFGTEGIRFKGEGRRRVSIRRADLGLSEPVDLRRQSTVGIRVSIRRADLGLSEPRPLFRQEAAEYRFNPPGGFGAFGTTCSSGDGRFRRSFNPPGGFGAFGTWCRRRSKPQQATVSIRRADLGLSERKLGLGRTGVAVGFNPPGGFGAFGTRPDARMERSLESFNPPGGFGAFGTDAILIGGGGAELFQSAGRIWGFRNLRPPGTLARCGIGFNPPGGFGAFGTARSRGHHGDAPAVSIRRADLGLSELEFVVNFLGRLLVSIRRADLGLSEPGMAGLVPLLYASFNPPGGFGAFGTAWPPRGRPSFRLFQSAGRIWGFRNAASVKCGTRVSGFQSAGRIWGFRNLRWAGENGLIDGTVSIRRADLGLSEPRPKGFRKFLNTFQSAGRIWGFRNSWIKMATRLVDYIRFNPPGGFGAFGTLLSSADYNQDDGFNPPGGFGAFGTGQSHQS